MLRWGSFHTCSGYGSPYSSIRFEFAPTAALFILALVPPMELPKPMYCMWI
jgi:hypothetical protein